MFGLPNVSKLTCVASLSLHLLPEQYKLICLILCFWDRILPYKPRVASGSQESSCLRLSTAKITDMCHHCLVGTNFVIVKPNFIFHFWFCFETWSPFIGRLAWSATSSYPRTLSLGLTVHLHSHFENKFWLSELLEKTSPSIALGNF